MPDNFNSKNNASLENMIWSCTVLKCEESIKVFFRYARNQSLPYVYILPETIT